MSGKAKKQSKNKKTTATKNTKVGLKKKIPYINLIYTSLFLSVLLIIFLLVFTKNIPTQVPLFYGFPDGEDQLAQKSSLMIPPLISMTMILINSTLAYFLRDDYIKKTLVVSVFVITLLYVLTVVKIVFLVGSF